MSERTQTTAGGIPVADNQNSMTAGPRRERIPERVVHAKGSGAYWR